MIACTRMFGHTVNNIEHIKQAVATYTSRAAEKLRRQKSAATTISVFLLTKEPSNHTHFKHGNTISHYTTLPIATSATNELIKAALQVVNKIFTLDKQYKKAGVILSGFVADQTIQANLFLPAPKNNKQLLMSTIDNINFSMQSDTIKFASSGTNHNWKMRTEMRSPCYTTRWAEMCQVK